MRQRCAGTDTGGSPPIPNTSDKGQAAVPDSDVDYLFVGNEFEVRDDQHLRIKSVHRSNPLQMMVGPFARPHFGITSVWVLFERSPFERPHVDITSVRTCQLAA